MSSKKYKPKFEAGTWVVRDGDPGKYKPVEICSVYFHGNENRWRYDVCTEQGIAVCGAEAFDQKFSATERPDNPLWTAV